jgi:hypothetical protein
MLISTKVYSRWDQQNCAFAHVTSLLVERKQTHILCKQKTLPTQERDSKLQSAAAGK